MCILPPFGLCPIPKGFLSDLKRRTIQRDGMKLAFRKGAPWPYGVILKRREEMTKKELVSMVAERNGIPKKTVEMTLEALSEVMVEALLQGEKISFLGLGSFSVLRRASRKGRNPRTGEPLTIPERKVIKFRPSKTLTERLRGVR